MPAEACSVLENSFPWSPGFEPWRNSGGSLQDGVAVCLHLPSFLGPSGPLEAIPPPHVLTQLREA